MISNSKLQQLFKNYKNLSEDEIQQLIVEVIKNERNVLKINHPIIFVTVQ